ncbi:MAG: amino acid ABC transporter permease [Pseudomonadota bacterium]
MGNFGDAFLNAEVLAKYAPSILEGMGVTVALSVLIVLAGTALGLGLATLRALSPLAVRALVIGYADIFRALPPLVLILIAYFGLPSVGVFLSSFLVLFAVLTLVLAAFAEEIFWAGIASVPKGQWEAARSTGLRRGATLIWIVLPQAVRLAIPPLTNRAIAVTKMTALGTVIGVSDILNQATTAQSFSGNASPLLLAAVAYIAIFLPLVILSRWLETRFAWRRV